MLHHTGRDYSVKWKTYFFRGLQRFGNNCGGGVGGEKNVNSSSSDSRNSSL